MLDLNFPSTSLFSARALSAAVFSSCDACIVILHVVSVFNQSGYQIFLRNWSWIKGKPVIAPKCIRLWSFIAGKCVQAALLEYEYSPTNWFDQPLCCVFHQALHCHGCKDFDNSRWDCRSRLTLKYCVIM